MSLKELYEAFNGKDTDKILSIIEAKPSYIKKKSPDKKTTLIHMDSMYCEKDVLLYLLDKGVKVDLLDRDGNTPLINAGNREIVNILIGRGADIHKKNKKGDSALHMATMCLKFETISALIEHGIDIESKNKDGETPLAISPSRKVAKLLIENGADPANKDKQGDPAISNVLFVTSTISDLQKNDEDLNGFISFLVSHGVDLNITNAEGLSLLAHFQSFESLFRGNESHKAFKDLCMALAENGAKAFEQKNMEKQSTGCFIATACYETDAHPDVILLRNFRDDKLLSKKLGRVFVILYYRYSPPVANWIRLDNFRRNITRHILVKPVVTIIKLFQF